MPRKICITPGKRACLACLAATEALVCASAGVGCPVGSLGAQLPASAQNARNAAGATPKATNVGETLGVGWTVNFPRGIGAAYGEVPPGYVQVARWVNPEEISLWLANGGTAIPTSMGAGGRVYVTALVAAKPGGTGPVRLDFAVPEAARQKASSDAWKQIMQPVQSTPIYNLRIHTPAGTNVPPGG
jgi:filamentous hemagglutinin